MFFLNMQIRWNFIGVLMLLGTSSAKADFIFEIDMDLEQPGVQATRQVVAGQAIDVGLLLRINGTSSLAAFSLGMNFDPSRVQVNSVDIPERPTGFEQVSEVSVDNVNGRVRPLDALNVNPANDLVSFSGIIARMNLVAQYAGDSQVTSINPQFQNILDGVLPTDNSEVTWGTTPGDGGVFFYGGTLSGVTAVPEPTSLLLASTAAGIMFLRRRWRQLLANTKPSKN